MNLLKNLLHLMPNYNYTFNGAINTLVGNCNKNAKERLKAGRKEAGICKITKNDLHELWNLQNGKCFYSGLPLNYAKGEWRVSVDRINNNKGYIRANIVLTCVEMNGRSTWSPEKIDEMLSILEQNITENYVSFDKPTTERKQYKKVIFKDVDGIKHKNCTYCDMFYPISDFKDRRNACQNCEIKTERDLQRIPINHLTGLLNGTFVSTENRKKKKKLKAIRDNSHDISIEFLIELYNNQKGLCAYSGLPLRFGSYLDTNWTTSIERKDVLKGYTKDNVCLVCIEFNVIDNTVKQTTTKSGTSGWSPEKFLLFLGYVWLKKGIITSEDELKIIIDMQKQTTAREYNGAMRTKSGIKRLISDYHKTRAKRTHGQILLLTSPANKKYVYQTEIIDQSIDNVFAKIKKAGHTVFIDEVDKYGKDAFTITPLLTCKHELLEDYQNMFIKEYNTITPNGLNPSNRYSKERNQKISDNSLKHGKGHDGRLLPFYMKYAKWEDRDGYRVEGHPLCKKKKYFINTPKTVNKKSYDELYQKCLEFLNELNAQLSS